MTRYVWEQTMSEKEARDLRSRLRNPQTWLKLARLCMAIAVSQASRKRRSQ